MSKTASASPGTAQEPPCTLCGHPGPFVPHILPAPDPRSGMKVSCSTCSRDITWDTHQWKSQSDGRWVCCACMRSTKPIRDMIGYGAVSSPDRELLGMLSACSEATRRKAILLLKEYGLWDRDLTDREVEEAGQMLADLIMADRLRDVQGKG